jgi:DNA-binding LytR/AlgR family response regulator
MIHVAILSHEAPQREFLNDFLSREQDCEILACCASVEELMDSGCVKDIDVLYASPMYVVNADSHRVINPVGEKKPLIVVVSSDGAAALKCYEVAGVVDYVVVPCGVERLYLSLHKTREMLSMVNVCIQTKAGTASRDYIFVKVDKKMVRLPLDDIYYVESVKDYIKIVTEKKSYLVYSTLTGFTASLPPDRFARIHRSYTIAIDKIEAIDGSVVEIMNTRLPFSKKYMKESFMTILY